MSILYCPPDARLGDVVPFYWKGDYHLFYAKHTGEELEKRCGHSWWHLVTRDFVHFDDWGEALPAGEPGSREAYLNTGSVIERQGTFHWFYPGHNHEHLETDTPQQVILHATSDDLRTWTRDPKFEFYAPSHYEKHSWGDPFVVLNEESNEYWMLLAARKTSGPKFHRGITALAESTDLKTWHVSEAFWESDMYLDIECADLFRMGDWWYLVHSGSIGSPGTCYRMSRSPRGPFHAPADETFDDWMFYAAKTAGDGTKRYAFGWVMSRVGEKDDGTPDYAGSLVVHEIVQQPDGTLTPRFPDTVRAAFVNDAAVDPMPLLGDWQLGAGEIGASANDRYSTLKLGEMPDECLIETRVTFRSTTAHAGLLLRADDALDNYYQVSVDQARQRLTIRRFPRVLDARPMVERPLEMRPGQTVTLRAIADGSCLVVYANDQTALSARMYDHPKGGAGLFVADGEVVFSQTSIKTRTA